VQLLLEAAENDGYDSLSNMAIDTSSFSTELSTIQMGGVGEVLVLSLLMLLVN
jgi:hypothetical protein